MPEPVQFSSPQEEIQHLEQKIIEKRRALEGLPHRDVVSNAIKEHTADSLPPSPAAAAQSSDTDDLDKDDIDKHIAAFVQSAFRDGVMHAVREARRTHNPRVVDALHDALVDHFVKDLEAGGLLHD